MVREPLFIIWNDRQKLNISILDEQHRGIVSIINTMHYYVKQGKGFDALLPTIIAMEQYSLLHFETEQAMMRKCEYPDYDAHVLLHSHLRDNLSSIKARSFIKKDTHEILELLKRWWISHINIEDKKHATWILEHTPPTNLKS